MRPSAFDRGHHTTAFEKLVELDLAKNSLGASLEQAMDAALRALDGFYTFVIGTESGFGVLRDPIACKPAVMAETDAWVAFGTEYRALADLPGVEHAKVWEPEPAHVYFWERPH